MRYTDGMAEIPGVILNELRCFRCKSFLSCGPVTIFANGSSHCGRCSLPGQHMFRAIQYEAIAIYFLFPCKYFTEHCAYSLNWSEVLDHEENCQYNGACSILCSHPGAFFKSDNKLDLNKDIRRFNLPEQLLDNLTCCVCSYYLSSSPIFVNNEGRGFCNRCYESKRQVPPNFIRHEALEKILEIMLFPCIYRNRGCTRFFRFGSNAIEHEIDCEYGVVVKKPKTVMTGSKERGVIETHSGHTWGTITPNSQFFIAQEKVTKPSKRGDPIKVVPNERQGVFLNQLIEHRSKLERSWNRNSEQSGESTPSDYDRSENSAHHSNFAQRSPSPEEAVPVPLESYRKFDEGDHPRHNYERPNGIVEPERNHNESYAVDVDDPLKHQQPFSYLNGPRSDAINDQKHLRPFSYGELPRSPSHKNAPVQPNSMQVHPIHEERVQNDNPSRPDPYSREYLHSRSNEPAQSFNGFDREGRPTVQRSESMYYGNQQRPSAGGRRSDARGALRYTKM